MRATFLVFLTCVLLSVVAPAAAVEMVYATSELTVRLHEEGCQLEAVRDWLDDAAPDTEPKKASVTIKGERRAACWARKGDRVLIADERGAAGFVPAQKFAASPSL